MKGFGSKDKKNTKNSKNKKVNTFDKDKLLSSAFSLHSTGKIK